MRIVIASSKKWFIESISDYDFQNHELTFIVEQSDLNIENLTSIAPNFIFFPHWNWKIPEDIINSYKCIVFHIANLPKGRGGSPIQNHILEGYRSVNVNALSVTKELDGGDIYLSKEVSLDGSLKEIFERISPVIREMINRIINGDYNLHKQIGNPTYYRRRKSEQNALPIESSRLEEIYDYIRMLDDPEYPHSFIEVGNIRLEFSNAQLKEESISAQVEISINRRDH